MSDNLLILVVGALVSCAAVVCLVSLYRRIRRRGGVAGVLAGADIEHTIDRVDAHSTGMSSGEMRVHCFANAPKGRAVGLEVVLRTPVSHNSMTAGLSAAQAHDLATMLRRGLGEATEQPRPRRAVRDGPI